MEIQTDHDLRWDGRIKTITWTINSRKIAFAHRRVGEEETYNFFSLKMTPDTPRSGRIQISREQCESEVLRHLETAKRYGFVLQQPLLMDACDAKSCHQ